ncbi:MAG: MerR family transcriptional regulator [Clostridium sp.]
MYQKYSIGTMAKLMGISAEAIRYYESRNIISPVRDPETGYRYYNTWDFHMLLRARHYQNYGFSLEEIAELFRSHELAEIREKMVDQEEMIQQEIIRQMNLLKRIRQSQQVLQDAKDSVGKFRIEERPGIYRMNTQKNYTLFKKKEQLDLISEWTEKEPFVFSCAVFYQKNIENGESEFDFGNGTSGRVCTILACKRVRTGAVLSALFLRSYLCSLTFRKISVTGEFTGRFPVFEAEWIKPCRGYCHPGSLYDQAGRGVF